MKHEEKDKARELYFQTTCCSGFVIPNYMDGDL